MLLGKPGAAEWVGRRNYSPHDLYFICSENAEYRQEKFSHTKWQKRSARQHIVVVSQLGVPVAADEIVRARIKRELENGEILSRVLLWAAKRCRERVWRGRLGGSVPGGLEAEDFVYEAVRKTLTGQRVWDHASVSLYQHLVGVVRSDISNRLRCKENRMTILESRLGSNGEAGRRSGPAKVLDLSQFACEDPSPEEVVLFQDELEKILQHVENADTKLLNMAKLMAERDLSGSIELSNELGVSVREVNNRKKRLRRLVEAFQRQKLRKQR